nr:MAG TPA_asm: hypothetical protein [Caudoviricetes sp.]
MPYLFISASKFLQLIFTVFIHPLSFLRYVAIYKYTILHCIAIVNNFLQYSAIYCLHIAKISVLSN